MKTAEEWDKEWRNKIAQLLKDNDNPDKEVDEYNLLQIKQIQLDAWKQGMEDAAKLTEGHLSTLARTIRVDAYNRQKL